MPILSTATAAPAQRFAAWREIITQHFIPLRPELRRDGRFCGEIHAEKIGAAGLSLIRSGLHRVHRGRAEIARGTAPILFVNVQLAGRSSYVQGEEETAVAPGDIFVIDPNRPFQLGCEAPFAQLSVKLPMENLRAWLRRPGDAAGVRLAGADPHAALLRAYACAAFRNAPALDPNAQLLAAHHLRDLAGLMLSAAPQPADAREALRTAMHVRALAAIRRRLGDAELSPRMIARAAGLSERLLHRLFQERGETVMGRARLERLDLAAQLLTSSPLRSVADIAFSCGFKDASHFARAFAARFGKTPTRWRDQGVV